MISAYFSMKNSHPELHETVSHVRSVLAGSGLEEGLLFILENFLPRISDMQLSWIGGELPIIRYEDLLEDDVALLSHMLLHTCKLPIPQGQFEKLVKKCRFERVTQGRSRGIEQVGSHERKAVAGDWQNYFTERVRTRFKERYNHMLIAFGYETNSDW
jgi:Sulfotransferase domain